VVIAEEFAAQPGTDLVLIYGSWAARYEGAAGPAPGDVDVLVVGAPDRAAVYAAAERAEARLGVPVNPVIRTAARWTGGGDPLVESIRAAPYLDVTAGDAVDEFADPPQTPGTLPQ
jgi:hypothetical protein